MHLFVYEFVTGGGWYSADRHQPPPEGLAIEGRAMLVALLADLAAIAGNTVSTLRDARFPALAIDESRCIVVANAAEEQAAFGNLAAQSDWTIVIAPEFEGFLIQRSRWVTQAGGRLLGSPPTLVELASDKHQTAEFLATAGIPAPTGWLVEQGAELPTVCPFPAVIKPIHGAGSLGVRLLRSRDDYQSRLPGRQRLEPYCAGLPASVACLCGPRQCLPLPACEQLLTSDGTFRYRGGRLPLAADLERRARRLAERVADCLPKPLGYLGIDLVLGDDPCGSQDYVIEINPRLTTSYLGMRALASDNLAAALLAVAAGREPALTFARTPLAFAPDGRLL